MLAPFGPLAAFNLVMDRTTGNSKGYAFAEYADAAATDAAVGALHGRPVGTKFVTVKRALTPAGF
jgi:RNA recognition motif-containing protein